MKWIDRITAIFAVWLLSTLWMKIWFSYTTAALIGIAITLLLFAAYRLGKKKLSHLFHPKTAEVLKAFALMGTAKQSEFFIKLFPDSAAAQCDGEFFRYEKNGKTYLVLSAIRFNDVSKEDVAKCYRKQLDAPADEILILGKGVSRDVMLFASELPCKISFPDRYSLASALHKKGVFPEFPAPEKKKKRIRLSWKEWGYVIFHRHRAKYYFISGFFLILLSFFTPLRLYYLGMATVPLLLGVVAALLPSTTDF